MSTELDAKKQAFLAAEAKRRGLAEWQLELMNGVSDDVIRDIVRDNMKSNQLSSIAAKTKEEQRADREEPQPIDRSGWQKPVELRRVEGLRYVDQQLDAQDERDRRDLVGKRLSSDLERRLKGTE